MKGFIKVFCFLMAIVMPLSIVYAKEEVDYEYDVLIDESQLIDVEIESNSLEWTFVYNNGLVKDENGKATVNSSSTGVWIDGSYKSKEAALKEAEEARDEINRLEMSNKDKNLYYVSKMKESKNNYVVITNNSEKRDVNINVKETSKNDTDIIFLEEGSSSYQKKVTNKYLSHNKGKNKVKYYVHPTSNKVDLSSFNNSSSNGTISVTFSAAD